MYKGNQLTICVRRLLYTPSKQHGHFWQASHILCSSPWSCSRSLPRLLSLHRSLLMITTRIIGIQSFNGSLRRTCYFQPTLGEQEIPIPTQFCGGHIDPTTLNVTSYVPVASNRTDPHIKGFICPLGQICKVGPCLHSQLIDLTLGTGRDEPIQQC